MVRLHPGPWSPASEDSLTSQILQSELFGWVKNHDPILENFEILTQGIQSHHYILMHHVF